MGRNKMLLPAALFCLAAAVLSLCLGSVNIRPGEILRFLTTGEGGAVGNILRFSRIPRTLACLLAGAALGVSGAVLQKVLNNPLASPSVIGINAGAGLGVNVCCALGLLSGWAVSVGAFLGAFGAVCMIFFLCRRAGASKTTVILSGVAMNSVLGACSEAISVLDPDVAVLSLDFRVGGFGSVSYVRLVPGAVLILLGLMVLLTLGNELDVLALGDETARGLGLKTGQYRILFLSLAALLAGAAVSFSGLLGFVGLLVPHFLRKIVGGESRCLLPMAALVGAGFVAVCDLGGRLLFAPFELPVGILMALLGGPAFAAVILRRKGGASNG